MDFTYFYHGFLYKWEQSKAKKTYADNKISIRHCCQAVFDCSKPEEQLQYSPPRWKYIGLSDVGIITVITEEDETRIITAWRSSKSEQSGYGR